MRLQGVHSVLFLMFCLQVMFHMYESAGFKFLEDIFVRATSFKVTVDIFKRYFCLFVYTYAM